MSYVYDNLLVDIKFHLKVEATRTEGTELQIQKYTLQETEKNS